MMSTSLFEVLEYSFPKEHGSLHRKWFLHQRTGCQSAFRMLSMSESKAVLLKMHHFLICFWFYHSNQPSQRWLLAELTATCNSKTWWKLMYVTVFNIGLMILVNPRGIQQKSRFWDEISSIRTNACSLCSIFNTKCLFLARCSMFFQ